MGVAEGATFTAGRPSRLAITAGERGTIATSLVRFRKELEMGDKSPKATAKSSKQKSQKKAGATKAPPKK